MTVGPVPSDPAWDPMTATAWAWSPDNPVKVFVVATVVFAAETAGP